MESAQETKRNNQNAKRIHRRTKNQISGHFVCGDHACKKSYGTNAALYTHIKQKHNGQQPEGTIRPKLQPIKGRKGRPIAEEDAYTKDEPPNEVCKICSYKQCKCLEKFDIEVIKLYSEQTFTEFIKELGALGEDQQTNVWVRYLDVELVQYKEVEIQKIAEQLINQSKHPSLVISKRLMKYLVQSSNFWTKEYIDQLYKGIFLILMYRSPESIKEQLAKNNQYYKLIQMIEKNQEAFERLVEITKII